jgi:integrase/recombinase XerD
MSTWTELREAWGAFLRVRRHPSTVKNYRAWLQYLVDFAQAQHLGPADVGPEVGDAFIQSLHARPLSLPTRMAVLSAIRRFYQWAVKQGHVFQDPFPDLVLRKVEPAERICPDPDAMEALMAQADQRRPGGLRDYTLMALMYGAGVRVSECWWSNVEDVDLKNHAMAVRHTKTGVARYVPLAPRLWAEMDAYLRAGRPPLLKNPRETALFLNKDGGRMSRTRMEQVVAQYGRRAGLGRVHPHLLRHAFGSHLVLGGADVRQVQMLLGHLSLNPTQTYVHLPPEALRHHLEQKHPRFQPDAPDSDSTLSLPVEKDPPLDPSPEVAPASYDERRWRRRR